MKKITLLLLGIISLSFADVSVSILKNKKVVNEKIVQTKDLKEGYTQEYLEKLFYINGLENGKPIISEEPMGIKYKLKVLDEPVKEGQFKYLMVVYFKTDAMVDAEKTELRINNFQKVLNNIKKINEDKKKIILEFNFKQENFEIEIGKEYAIHIKQL